MNNLEDKELVDAINGVVAAAVASERERCAKVCRDKAEEWKKRASRGDMARDAERHAVIAAGQIEAIILGNV